MLQPYDPCPCGSGKKFKWCCQAIYADIRKAQDQFEMGQQDAALRLIDTVVQAHSDNPEAWGNKAMLLARAGKIEEAEEALEEAFKRNPQYPTGLLLRAQFRLNEGELPGALLLARRAAEAFDPAAHDFLAQVYHIIFDAEMSQQRVLAAHTALSLTVRFAPAAEQLRQVLDTYFGPEGPLPEAARKQYAFRLPAPQDAARRARWDRELPEIPASRLGMLATLCEEIAQADEKDTAAWFNLGVVRAWLGDHPAAVAALEKSLAHETDDARAREASALGEVLRMGLGMEAQCDYLQHGFAFQITNAQAATQLLRSWHEEGRMLVQPTEEQHTIAAIVLDFAKSIATGDAPVRPEQGTFAAYLHIVGAALRMRGPNRESIERLRDIFREKLGLPADVAEIHESPMPFHDLILPSLIFPTGPKSQLTPERVQELARKHFTEKWIHQPLKSLAGNSPIDAAGSAVLKRKLAGVVDFLSQCCEGPYLNQADFNVVRHKLGLAPVAVPAPQPTPQPVAEVQPEKTPTTPTTPSTPTTPTAPATPATPALKIPGMNAAELGTLDVASLTVPQLEQAHQTAAKLDAKELAKHFAETLIARPAEASKNDRYPFYSYLILRSLADNEPDKAISYAEAGGTFDAEHNNGARRDDFDLRKGQVFARKGDADKAAEVFDGVLERSPDNVKVRIEVIETFLRLKKGKLALRFAEAGIERARDKMDRDSEGHFEELAASARKMG
jgi:tetratricopeptide (TPR) repeat protein